MGLQDHGILFNMFWSHLLSSFLLSQQARVTCHFFEYTAHEGPAGPGLSTVSTQVCSCMLLSTGARHTTTQLPLPSLQMNGSGESEAHLRVHACWSALVPAVASW